MAREAFDYAEAVRRRTSAGLGEGASDEGDGEACQEEEKGCGLGIGNQRSAVDVGQRSAVDVERVEARVALGAERAVERIAEVAGAEFLFVRKAKFVGLQVKERDVAVEGAEDAALIAGAGGAGEKGAVGEKMIVRIEEFDGAAAVAEEAVKAGDAALNDLRGSGGGEDESVGAERNSEADGTADEVIGRDAESGRRRIAGGGERNLIGLRETGGEQRQNYRKKKPFHHAPKKNVTAEEEISAI